MKSNARQQSALEPTLAESEASADPALAGSVTRIGSAHTSAIDSGSATESERWQAPAGEGQRSPIRLWILLLLAVIAGVVAWIAMRDPAAPAPIAAPAAAPLELAAVDVVAAQPRVLSRQLPLSGTMSPVVQATVKSKVSGDVEEVTVREGQDVRQGDVIARIDTRNLQAQYDREVAAVEKARADMDLATLNRDKNRTLLEQHFISQNTYETTESAYAASVASFKLAQAQARMMKINLDDAVIRAPFSGTVSKRLVQPGGKVSSDSEIVSLVDLRQMLLEAAVPAAEIPSVHIGQSARFKVGGFGDREFTGEVQRINPVTTDGSRSIVIYIAVANADRALKGGMFAQGQLTLEATQPVLSVPRPAIHEEAGMTFVYTLADGKIGRRDVKLGNDVQDSPFVEVRSGLSAGERIIVTDIGDNKAGVSAFVRGEKTA
ncbi:MAG TPA: efflux RND transporter periplasmic adaptor subunit [Povalibacter sp.]|nr:efflux RND transporter periplasmic adaptor subunit [Povalibacter sp.]